MAWNIQQVPHTHRYPRCGGCNRRLRKTPLTMRSGLCYLCRGMENVPDPPGRIRRHIGEYDIVIFQSTLDGLYRGTDFSADAMERTGAHATAGPLIRAFAPTAIPPEDW